MSTNVLTKGNSKLGPDIWTFSLSHASCIGKTKICDSICYVKDYIKRYASVSSAYLARGALAETKYFTQVIIDQINRVKAKMVRVHVSGDFYSPGYTQKWIDIANACPQTTFQTFTRAWIVPKMVPKLTDLASLSNVILALSLDKDNVKRAIPRPLKGYRKAYLSLNDSDLPPKDAFIDFRHARDTIQYKLNGVRVCPHEYSNTKKHHNIKCSRCLKCYR